MYTSFLIGLVQLERHMSFGEAFHTNTTGISLCRWVCSILFWAREEDAEIIKMQDGESPPEMKSCFVEQVDEAYPSGGRIWGNTSLTPG